MLFAFASESEREKFDAIYGRYKNLMLHKAYEILSDYMLAEDAVSEAFIRVYKNLHKIDADQPVRTASFLVTIVRNVSLTMVKQRTQSAADEIPETVSSGYDLERQVVDALSHEEIMRLVDALGDEHKGVFLLKYAYDMSHREIGVALGITENNVTVRLHRAKRKLCDMLKKEGRAHEA